MIDGRRSGGGALGARAPYSFTQLRAFIFLRGPELHTPLSTEATFNKTLRGLIDITNVTVLYQGFERHRNLRPFVWNGTKLGFGEKGMEDTQVGMSKLK